MEFVRGQQAGLGHPNSLLASGDSLFVADMATSGALAGTPTGLIYQITFVPEPAAAGLVFACLGLGTGIWLRRRR